MIFVTGPLFSGKSEYIVRTLGWSEAEFEAKAMQDVQELVREEKSAQELEALAVSLTEHYEVVIASEVGGGVVPVDPAERLFREQAGRLACFLAERADTVIRICCGLPQVLKGEPL